MNNLELLQKCLKNHGVESEILKDRKEAPYLNVGDVKHVVNRMQFWIPKNRENEIHVFIGKEMGKWYAVSSESNYINSAYRYSFKENKLEFPNVELAIKFIEETMGK